MKDTENRLAEDVQTYRERKAKWVEYLRSKKYQQVKDSLRDWNGAVYSYCCLGVACDLHQEITGEGVWGDMDDSHGSDLLYYVGRNNGVWTISAEANLPDLVAEWLGLRTEVAHTSLSTRISTRVSLIDLNDDLGWDFDRIADFIDSEPPGLFMWNLEGGVNGETDHPLWKEAVQEMDGLSLGVTKPTTSPGNAHT